MRGMTISFAGKPNINARSIVPSSPKICAKGLSAFEQRKRIVLPFSDMFANSHITSPHGAAIQAALANTKSVLSSTERIKTSHIFGFR